MTKLGYRPFAQPPKWLADVCQRRFAKAIVTILQDEPDLTDLQVGNALLAWFEPEPLHIGEPLGTSLSWATRPRWVQGEAQACYLHEAQIAYSGTGDLLRLVATSRYQFTTWASWTEKIIRLRRMQPDHDVDGFRALIEAEVIGAREAAANQEGPIAHFRAILHTKVDYLLSCEGIDALRDHARELKRITYRRVEE